MSDTPLSTDELAAFARRLLELRAELEEALALGRSSAQPVVLDQQAVGRLSRVDALQQQQMAASVRRRALLRLEQIGAAERALVEGDYGECRRCGEPISRGRLGARPESPTCVRCQSQAERAR